MTWPANNANKKRRESANRKAVLPGVSSRRLIEQSTNAARGGFPIVGVGASAGGLEAFTQLLNHLPTDTGLGFVLVQHLDPQHESALAQILARATAMPVREAANNLEVEPNHVYVISPNTHLSISRGVLKLRPRERSRSAARSIDCFFESLAEDRREHAIGVILSGTATDGTLGLEAIKAEGGITFAQDDTAKYDSMPRSAIAAGCVDFVLKPEDVAKELARIASHPYVVGRPPEATLPEDDRATATAHRADQSPLPSGGHGAPRTGARTARDEAASPRSAPADESFKKVLLLLRNHSGVDFSLYKSSTIQRRITRRVVLSKYNTMEEYARFLRGNASELDILYSDVLISVTSFFRNREAFESLRHKVLPNLLQQRNDEPLRVWVLGCSTGQEAYSIAMVFSEAVENLHRSRSLQVFATDLNDALLDKARHGLYARSLADDVSPDRLRRFFTEEEGGYRVIKPIRDTVVFARHNVISDPPFSRMDLISCRNLLIYLEPSLQNKAIPTFHYALKPGGFLFLGASESIGAFDELFEPIDKKHKIFVRKAASPMALHLPFKREQLRQPISGARPPLPVGRRQVGPPEGFPGELTAQREADRISLNQFTPPGVLINADLQILQFRGPTGAWLQPPPTGKATFDLLKMAREGLMLPLRAAINKAKKDNKAVRKENVRVQQNGNIRAVNLEVIPLRNLRERAFLILFQDAKRAAATVTDEPAPDSRRPRGTTRKQGSDRLQSLETELSETRDYLRSLQEQHEAATEELQASNEEIQSANEELQSINEELETSKEELESSNEELTTVNEEMANRNAELSRLNADLNNLQASTKLPILLLGHNLAIRRFSAPAAKLFDLFATDVGQPLSRIRHDLFLPPTHTAPPSPPRQERAGERRPFTPPLHRSGPPLSFPLEDFLREVIDTVREEEREACDKNGHWYSLRARPYMTADNKIDGAVLVLVDIDDLKRTQEQMRVAREYAEATIRTARDPLVILRADLRVDKANDAFYKTFKVTPQETENILIYELDGGQWNISKLRHLLEEIIPRNSFFNDFEVTHDFDHIGRRIMLLNARRLDNPTGAPERVLLGIEDVTEWRRASEAVSQLATIVQHSDDAIFTRTLDGVVTTWNPGAEKLFGYSAREMVGQNVSLLVPPARTAEAEPMHDELRRGGRLTHFETAAMRKDQSLIWISLSVSPLRDHAGVVTAWSAIARDMTQSKQAEERRARIHDELALELAGTQQLQGTSTALIQDGGTDNLYQKLLDAAVAIMGSSMASIQMIDEARGELRLLAVRGFHPRSAAFWERVTADSRSSSAAALRDTKRIIVPDIELSPLLANSLDLDEYRRSAIRAVQSTPLISRSGRLIGVISTHWREPHQPGERELRLMDVLGRQAADLIERAQTEQARTKLASIVESSDDAIVSMDLDAIITSWNRGAERLFGYTAQEAIGKSVTILIPPDRLDEEPLILERIRRGEAVEHYETVRRRNNGILLDISLTVSPIRNTEGRVVGASKIARDITDRKKAEHALRETQALLVDRAAQLEQLVAERTERLQDTISELEHFSYSITHDMRAPLRAMQGFAGMLAAQLGDSLSRESADYLRRLTEAAARMDALIRDSLQYAKVVREKIPLVTVDSAAVLRGVLESYPALQPPQVQIEIAEPLPPVIANQTGLAQCFSNLLTNAIKFVKPDVQPKIRIWAEVRRQSNTSPQPPSTINSQPSTHLVRFWFKDNGIGIPPQYHERIFGIFQQLDKSYEGTGIGLALVRKTAERMNGKVGTESESGKGSNFWLEFQAAPGDLEETT